MARRDRLSPGPSLRRADQRRLLALINVEPELFTSLDCLFGPERAGAIMVAALPDPVKR